MMRQLLSGLKSLIERYRAVIQETHKRPSNNIYGLKPSRARNLISNMLGSMLVYKKHIENEQQKQELELLDQLCNSKRLSRDVCTIPGFAKAKVSLRPRDTRDLATNEGDTLLIINEQSMNTYYAQNLTTHQEGFISKSDLRYSLTFDN